MYNYSKIMDDCICIVYQCNSGNLIWVKLTLLFLQCIYVRPHSTCHLRLQGEYKVSCHIRQAVRVGFTKREFTSKLLSLVT